MMSECPSEIKAKKSRLHDKSYQEELQLNLDELATSVTELVQVLSPLVQQTQDLTEAVGEHLHLTVTLTEFMKSQAAKSYTSQQTRPATEADQIESVDN